MKIHLFGAAGSGVTTLGTHLAGQLGVPYYDSDSFFWETSAIPFTVRREPALRNQLMLESLATSDKWIMGGSVFQWGLDLTFDLAVFLWIPPDIRLQRIRAREYQRYGNSIYTHRKSQYEEFIDWCAGYDDNTAHGRTLQAHENWMRTLSYPLLQLRGDLSVEQRAAKIRETTRQGGRQS